MIFVSVRLLLGSWPTCQPDKKVIWPTVLFSNSKHFFVQLLSQLSAGRLMQCAIISHVVWIIIKLYSMFIVYNVL